jgi:methyl-accepting chemotaxis protein
MSVSIKENAEEGIKQVENMMQAVTEISEASQSISKIIKTIDDIAFQTNILALNAAVEAARAGQHGKGFAVVADEVRNLASESAQAAKDTSSMIAESVEKSNLGLTIATETSAGLREFVDGIMQSTEIVAKIAQSSNEQSEAILQVNRSIDQVSQVIQQNSATAEESAAASEEMSSQASLLQECIGRFRLRNDFPSQVLETPSKNVPQKQPTEVSIASFSGKY